jgi:anti-sigma regulatory factor (Ser/Thr protein kinase)
LSEGFFQVDVDRGVVRVFGDLRLNSLASLTGALHHVASKARYKDITLDLASLSSLTNSVVAPLAAYLRRLVRDDAIDFSLIEPRNLQVKSRVVQLGLAHYIDYRKYPKPRPNSSDPSVLQFKDHSERELATDKVINNLLRTAKLSRRNLAALEWAVNEITDNVITHSESKVGGFIICGKIAKTNIVEFTVADAGIGVSRSLKIADEREAVERAIQEGVTKNKSTNQGNGLYGTYRLALGSAGIFALKSRHGSLYVTKEGEMHTRHDPVPFNGTFVVCQIDCDNSELIERAFVFAGKAHTPAFDYIERKHEESEIPVVKAGDICKTFGSRLSGIEARTYLSNVINGSECGVLKVDFSGIHVISSSFADEVFGKLFVELGPMRFMRGVQIINADSVVVGLIDRAITLRSQTGL